MPLVVPGVTNQDASGKSIEQQWQEKLMGKKLGEASDTTTFAKKDLPENHRVVESGGMMTRDFKPDRLNVHLGEDGTVHKVSHG